MVWLTPFLVRFSIANGSFVPKRSGNQAQPDGLLKEPFGQGKQVPGGLEESALRSSVLVSQQTTGPIVEKRTQEAT